jgi:purine-binding chemotaxis protein CheW
MTGALVIRCGDRLLALPLPAVREVFRMVAMAARLPRAPQHCLGVVDVRGQLLPVFDLGARLQLAPPRSEAQLVDGHVVVVGSDAASAVGYAVDEVRELNELPVQPLTAGANTPPGLTIGAVRCSDGRLAPLVEPGSLLSVLTRQRLRAALAALEDSGASP